MSHEMFWYLVFCFLLWAFMPRLSLTVAMFMSLQVAHPWAIDQVPTFLLRAIWILGGLGGLIIDLFDLKRRLKWV
jgi:hypothetical protein